MTNTFNFDGRAIPFRPGDTMADALFREGVRVWRHSYSMGRPEGLYCGIGRCGSCRALVDGLPNRVLCFQPASTGATVQSYARGERPRVPTAVPVKEDHLSRLHVPVVIVGGGRSGRRMQTTLTHHGVQSLLFEERPWRVPANTDMICGAIVGLFEDKDKMRLVGVSMDTTWDIRTDAVILATGAVVVPPAEVNHRLPGVLTADALQALQEKDIPLPDGGLVLGVRPEDESAMREMADKAHALFECWRPMSSIHVDPDGWLTITVPGRDTRTFSWIGVSGASIPSLELWHAWRGPDATWADSSPFLLRDGRIWAIGRAVSDTGAAHREDIMARVLKDLKEARIG